MLTLENFEVQISPVIIQRGSEYYNDDLVVDLEEIAENIWSAEVCGSDDYLVNVSLNDRNEICDFSCDCPYDGPICKHIVAVCYAIREEKAKKKLKPVGKQMKSTFEDLLNTIELDEYKDFIRRHASHDKNFKTKFELFFSEKMDNPDLEKKYSDLIGKIIRTHSDRGYLDYRSTQNLAKEIDHLLAQGEDMIFKNNFRDAFSLNKALLKTMIEVLRGCDDSSGAIGGALFSTVDLFSKMACSDVAAPALKQEIFDFLHIELAQGHYFNYGDFGYDLFSVYRSLAVLLDQSAVFIDFIDSQCVKLTGEYENYQREFFQKEKIAFYIEKGRAKEAEELIQQNLDIVEVRQSEVDKAFSRKDYTAAKRLIADGIKIAEDKKRPGTVSQWKKGLLRIAVAENDTESVRCLSRSFMFDGGFDKEYYQQWKQTYSTSEQKDAVESLIAERIEEANREHSKYKTSFLGASHPSCLQYVGAIYVEEHMWDKLFELVQIEKNLNTLLQYHKHLAKRYPKEITALYIPEFRILGSRVDGRSQYADLAGKMSQILKDIPESKESITALVNELKAKNPRRPAMIEELNRVLEA